jgi:NAD(P)-dependent dehydrogenase (short-subunit alcohol dehydrogenase family)
VLLKKRIALVVGGGRGLGRCIAQAYAREGATVIAADLDRKAAEETIELIGQKSTGAAEAIDISNAAACSALADFVAKKFGSLDIMVNCAAICLVDPLLDVTPSRWEKVFAVNTHGAFYMMQASAKVMIPRKFGRIIQISTPASRMGFPNFASYAASKAALDSMCKAAAVAWGQFGITINTIVPGRMTGGMIDDLEIELTRVTGKSAEELKAERTKGLPIPRRVEPAEVAESAVWLACDQAAYVNGSRFNFTGGMELS